MPKATVDGIEVEFESGMSVLQVCELAGKEIPRFCYHERLSVAGNCRMCLVQIEGGPPKPAASCAMPCNPDMVVHTNTPMVKKAREGVLEFLLINHPLDCPICDQGGECDLQDQAMAYGLDKNRFNENKRIVEDKNMGPLIQTAMTRCIHCTRCMRFTTEVAGVTDIGLTGRGESAEITTYLEKAVDSELSGNVIDLCPVGALTSKPFLFTARSWELRKTETIDAMDAVGTNIRVDVRGPAVMRIQPRLNEDVNEEWLSDKGRFIWDGLKRQRLDQPYVRIDGKLQPATWEDAFSHIAAKVKTTKPSNMAAIAGDMACTESMYALKKLLTGLGVSNLDCRQDGVKLGGGSRAGYLFNSGIAGIDDADAILIIGSNVRWEAPIINARIRKRYLEGDVRIAGIGVNHDLSYPIENLGAGPDTLQELAEGKHSFAEVLKSAERPMVIVGQGALARADGGAILKLAASLSKVTDEWNGFNVLHTAAARVAGLDLGFVPGDNGKDVAGILEAAKSSEIDFVYLLGADELDVSGLEEAFVVYQGSHGDKGAHVADVILPGAAYTEKDALWVNTEGRVQAGQKALFAPGQAKEDWAIIRALSAYTGDVLPFNNLGELRGKLFEEHPHFARLDTIEQESKSDLSSVGGSGSVSSDAFVNPIDDYYLTNPIARASATMADCSHQFVKSAKEGAA